MHVDIGLHTWDCLIYKMKKKKLGKLILVN